MTACVRCQHPLDQTHEQASSFLDPPGAPPDLVWPDWSPCSPDCNHGGNQRWTSTLGFEARGRHPVGNGLCAECAKEEHG